MSSQKRTFLYQVNVTRDCNLRCTHCYISTDKKVASQYMEDQQFIRVFDTLIDFLQSPSGKSQYSVVEIHVIGGEPTMLGYDFFARILPQVKDRLSQVEQEVRLTLVSNLVTKDAVEIAKLFDAVATSYEFNTRFVSLKGRPLKALEEQWISNVNLLRDAGYEVTVTMAVTKQATQIGAHEVLSFFFDKGFRQIHLGFFIPSGDGLINMLDVFPLFEETSKFMIDACDWYLARREKYKDLYINPVESMIDSIYYDKPLDDIICPIIPGSIDVDWDGETVTCIEAGGEVDMDSLGNIYEQDLSQILSSVKYIKERATAIMPKPHCVGCDEFRSCQSACGILHQYWNGQGECPGFKGFIKHVRGVTDQGVKPKHMLFTDSDSELFRGC
ncbi:radical SAM protein [Pseudomonas syringae pv. actinidiae]|nr:radical SAM protein [Pseudomonas syringae pv. actinidiae]